MCRNVFPLAQKGAFHRRFVPHGMRAVTAPVLVKDKSCKCGDLFSVSQLTPAESPSLLTCLNDGMLPVHCNDQMGVMQNWFPAYSKRMFHVLHQISYEVFQHQAEP